MTDAPPPYVSSVPEDGTAGMYTTLSDNIPGTRMVWPKNSPRWWPRPGNPGNVDDFEG
jgi:hypothetical protein